MKKVKEYEKKLLLTEREYLFLRSAFGANNPVTVQTNYYFDTDDFAMNQKGITCRIRQKDGIYQVTVKTHGKQKSDCSVEEDLFTMTEFDPSVFSSLGVRLQGELVTGRMVLFKNAFCEMVLDRNTYLGAVDYELETEYLEDHEKQADRLINYVVKAMICTPKLSCGEELYARIGTGESKSERFFARKCMLRR